MEVYDKIAVLSDFSDHLKEELFSREFTAAYMKDTGHLRKDILEREVCVPVSILDQICNIGSYATSPDVDPGRVGSCGKIAVLLPRTGINAAIVKAICTSFLIGNKVVIKLSHQLKHTASYLRLLLMNHLWDIEFAPEEQSVADFISDCISSSAIKAIVIYGNDDWVKAYKSLVRRGNTKLIFEGPGNNPQIVLKGADVDMAVKDAVKSGLINGGQSSWASERFFVDREIAGEFVAKLADKIRSLKIGSPEDDGTDLGPIVSDALINRMISQVIDARHKGGKVLSGGRPVEVDGSGMFSFLPTIVTECTTDMRIVRESNFGPLFPIITFSSDEDLVEMVDESEYGLDASIYGSPSEALVTYMDKHYRNVYINSTVDSFENSSSWIVDGGFRNSGFIWEWSNGSFIQREGRRMLVKELSVPYFNIVTV